MRLLGGQRSRTPVRPSSSCSDSAASLLLQSQYDGGDSQHSRTVPRLPSWPSHSRDTPGGVSPIVASSADILVKEADRVWHNPSIAQMAEALRVAMMTKPTLEALDPRYNAYVLHLIEGYGRAQAALTDTERQLAEAQTARQRDRDESATTATDWAIREARYKAEIKRLEVIIHRTSGNSLEAVVMARSGSLVDRRGQGVLELAGQTGNTVYGE